MTARNVIAVVLLAAMLASTSPYSVQPQAQMSVTCARELDRPDRELKAFDRNVNEQVLDFVSTDAVGVKYSDVKTVLAGKPDQVALRKLRELKQAVLDLAAQLMTFEQMMVAMTACLTNGPPRCLSELAGRQSGQYAKWIQAVAEQGLSGAAERVNNARSLVHDYATKSMSMAEGSTMRGIDACIDRVERAVQAEERTVELRGPGPAGGTTPAAPGAEPVSRPAPDPGSWNGFIWTAAVLGGGAVTAFAYRGQLAELLNSGGDTAKCGPAPSIDYNPAVRSRPTDAQLSAYRAWCQSCGYSGSGTLSNGGFGCVK